MPKFGALLLGPQTYTSLMSLLPSVLIQVQCVNVKESLIPFGIGCLSNTQETDCEPGRHGQVWRDST